MKGNKRPLDSVEDLMESPVVLKKARVEDNKNQPQTGAPPFFYNPTKRKTKGVDLPK